MESKILQQTDWMEKDNKTSSGVSKLIILLHMAQNLTKEL